MSPILYFNVATSGLIESNRATVLDGTIETTLKRPVTAKISVEFIGLSTALSTANQKQFIHKQAIFTISNSKKLDFVLDIPAIPPTTNDPIHGQIKYLLKAKITWHSAFRTHSQTCLKDITSALSQRTRQSLLYNPQPLTSHLPINSSKVDLVITLPKRVVAPKDKIVADIHIRSVPAGRSLRYVDVSLRTSIETLSHANLPNSHPLSRPLDEIRDIPSSIPSLSHRLSINSNWHKTFSLLVDPQISRPSVDSPCFSIKTWLCVEVVLDDSPIPNIELEIPITVVGDALFETSRNNLIRSSWLGFKKSTSVVSSEGSVTSLTVPFTPVHALYTPPASPSGSDGCGVFDYDGYMNGESLYPRPSAAQQKLDALMSQIRLSSDDDSVYEERGYVLYPIN